MSRERTLWLMVGAGCAIVSGVAARHVAAEAWRRGLDEEPPINADDAAASWTSVLVWAGVSGACVAFARAVGRGAANRGWRKVLGREPPFEG